MGSRRKARECALQMLFAADVAEMPADEVVRSYWAELGESDLDATAREFATRTLAYLAHGSRRSQHPAPRRLRVSLRANAAHRSDQRSARDRAPFLDLRSHAVHQRHTRRHQARPRRTTATKERAAGGRRYRLLKKYSRRWHNCAPPVTARKHANFSIPSFAAFTVSKPAPPQTA